VIALVLLGALLYAVVGPFGIGKGSWITVGSLTEIKAKGVVDERRAQAFIVADRGELFGLSAIDPHLREADYYCPSSGWFEDPARGSVYDHHGYYRGGPSPHGLDHVPVRMEHGFVSVNPSQRTPGFPRGTEDGAEVTGERCSGNPRFSRNQDTRTFEEQAAPAG
jgi:nitrite reductase/ring-hydroxylating ferredoxin subunit